MNPITHFLAGWTVANIARLDKKERAFVTFAGVIPDIDGLGLIAEQYTANSAHPLEWWSDYHHVIAHNIFFGLMVAGACTMAATRRKAVAALALLSFGVHILGDVTGAGGPGGERWPIPFLWPFTDKLTLEWQGQWLLDAWQNIVITGLLIVAVTMLARCRGYSALEIISGKMDAAFVGAIRGRFGRCA